jgi:hypothetical protein
VLSISNEGDDFTFGKMVPLAGYAAKGTARPVVFVQAVAKKISSFMISHCFSYSMI